MTLVHRTRRTLAGVVLSEEWSEPLAPLTPNRLPPAKRLSPRKSWEGSAGLETQPWCRNCGSLTVWRGHWQCVGCAARGATQQLTTDLPPSALPREALAGVPIFSSSEGNNSTAALASWRYAVESLTSMHRASTSAKLLKRGTRTTEHEDWSHDDDGVITAHGSPKNGELGINRWHAQRMKGQAERFERVASCGRFDNAIEYDRPNGEHIVQALRTRCDCWRVCTSCQNRRKWKLTEGMKQQRSRALEVHKWAARKGYRGPEGKWSEKLLTFTVPHGPEGPASDARVLVDAWQLLLRRVRRHLLARGAARKSASGKRVAVSVPWCRALEVATRNGEHAHLHVWWFGPYLDVVLMHVWWGELMQARGLKVPTKTWGTVKAEAGQRTIRHGIKEKGRTIDRRMAEWLDNPTDETELPWGICDLTSDHSGDGALADYSQKVGLALYVVKGTNTERMEPAHVASIYETFEGTRAVQWARGWAPPKKPLAARCVTFRRLTDEEKRNYNHTRIHGAKSHQDDSGSAAVGTGEVGERASAASARLDPLGGLVSNHAGMAPGSRVPIPAQLAFALDLRKRARSRKSW